MTDILSSLNRMVMEPKIYALIVRSKRGQVLHLGVHFTLEEAYSAARKRMLGFMNHSKGEAIDIDLWNVMPARQAIAQMVEPSHIQEVFKKESPAGSEKQKSETEQEQPPNTEVPEDFSVFTGDPTTVVMPANGEIPEILQALLSGKLGDLSKELIPELTLNDHVQDVKDSKNDLMRKLITDGNLVQVEKVKSLLGTASYKYVVSQIQKKTEIKPSFGNGKIKGKDKKK